MHLSKWQKRILRVAVTVALIVGIFWFIPFSDVVEALRSLEVGYVVGSFSINLLVIYLESVQLWMLLRRAAMQVGLWKVIETKMVTRFYGQFLPSELMAAAVKFYRLAGPTKQWGEVAAALAFFRVINMLTLVSLGVVFWLIEMPSGPGRWVGLLLIGMAAGLIGVHLAITSPTLRHLAGTLLSTRVFRWLEGALLDKVRALMRTVIDSYALFRGLLWPIGLLGLLRHALGIVGFGLVAASLDIQLSYLTLGWIRVVIQGLMMLPISLSGIGLREASLVILLEAYDVPASDAVALAFVLFILNVTANSLGGMLELANVLRPKRPEVEAESGSK